MQKRMTARASGGQKRQVRLLQHRFENQGVSKAEARILAEAKGNRMRQTGERIISHKAETAALSQQPKRKQGVRLQGGKLVLPKRITSKRAEAVTTGLALRKRSTK